MSSLVLAGQIWDSHGNVRERLTVPASETAPAPDVLEGILSSIRPELAKALSGVAVTVQKEAGGLALLCQLLPLARSDGSVVGALALVSDVTESARFEERLHARVAFEKQIAALSSQFINLAPEDVDRAISDGLLAIGVLAKVDRAYVFLFSEDGASYEQQPPMVLARHRAVHATARASSR